MDKKNMIPGKVMMTEIVVDEKIITISTIYLTHIEFGYAYETMIFDDADEYSMYQQRCKGKDEAQLMHIDAIAHVVRTTK